jgi:hypothetical protein
MTSDKELSPLATLRGECLHLAVKMLGYSDTDPIAPRDAIRLAEEYVAWILEAGHGDAMSDPGPASALRPARSGLSDHNEAKSRH